MKKDMRVPAILAFAGLALVGCSSRELTETQRLWLDETEVLVEAKDPEMTAQAKTGIAAIDAVADSITMLSTFSTGAMTRYIYEQDAKAAWMSYARWSSSDADVGEQWNAINEKEQGSKERQDLIAAFLAEAQAESRFQTFPTVLKRTATKDTVEAATDALIAYDQARMPDGEVGDAAAQRENTKAIVDANYKNITLERNKTVTVDGVAKTVYKTAHGGEATLDNEASALESFQKIVSESIKKSIESVAAGGKPVLVTSPTDLAFTYVGNAPAEVKDAEGKVIPDSLLVDELTNRPVAVRETVEKDLAVILVKCFEGLRPKVMAMKEAEDEETRKAATAAYEAAAAEAEKKFLAAMEVEQIDWGAAVAVLTMKATQATADMAALTAAIKDNQSIVTGLAFGKAACEDISASESLAALNRIRAQAALNVKLLPRLVSILSAKVTE